MLGAECSADLERWGGIAVVETQAYYAAAEVVVVGLGFCQFVCFAADSGQKQEYVLAAADTGWGH